MLQPDLVAYKHHLLKSLSISCTIPAIRFDTYLHSIGVFSSIFLLFILRRIPHFGIKGFTGYYGLPKTEIRAFHRAGNGGNKDYGYINVSPLKETFLHMDMISTDYGFGRIGWMDMYFLVSRSLASFIRLEVERDGKGNCG